MDQVSIKYTNIFDCKTLKNLPKFGFLVWKQTIWQPCKGHLNIVKNDLIQWRRYVGSDQGDQVRRIFACWIQIVYLKKFFKKNRGSPHCRSKFFHGKSYVSIVKKVGFATFWAIFSQTRLVPLELIEDY
jgi:hypothetical protein